MAIAGKAGTLLLPGSVVPADNLHLTLRFLGESDSVGLDRLLAALDAAAFPSPFVLRLGGFGAFPNADRASVLWIGVSGASEQLEYLHAAVEESCEAAGFDFEERPFRPHVTVSRMRPPVDVRSILSAAPPLGVSSPVDEIVVLRSHLSQGPPRYELLERFSLA